MCEMGDEGWDVHDARLRSSEGHQSNAPNINCSHCDQMTNDLVACSAKDVRFEFAFSPGCLFGAMEW